MASSGAGCARLSASRSALPVHAKAPHETAIIAAPYGSERESQAVALCEHNRNTIGFAAQFNYNLLPAGTYTAQARADGQTIDTNTFTVVRISDQGYLTGVSSGDVTVPDFPRDGDTTVLEWDESSQNFQIKEKTP